MIGYLHCTFLLYIEKIRSDQNLSSTYPALVIFNQFKGQTIDRFLLELENNNSHVLEVSVILASISYKNAHEKVHFSSGMLRTYREATMRVQIMHSHCSVLYN